MKYRLNDSAELYLLPLLTDNYAYVIRDEAANVTAIVDPGEAEPVIEFLQEQGWQLDAILCTHHHWDHTNGNPKLVEQYGCEVVGFAPDAERIQHITTALEEGDSYNVGSVNLRVIHNPGHTTGAITFYAEKERIAFVGDTLFAMGCGRLFEGDPEQMLASLDKLAGELADDTRIFNGHEYALTNASFSLLVEPQNGTLQTRVAICQKQQMKNQPCQGATLQMEKETNPFLRPDSKEIAEMLGMADAGRLEVFAALREKRNHFVA